jgi:hypothetical protein
MLICSVCVASSFFVLSRLNYSSSISKSTITAVVMSDTFVGSLTTTFSPLPSCLTDLYRFVESNLLYVQLGPTSTSDCLPSSFAPTGYYSPGICPSGYTQACSGVASSGTLAETRATCCPRLVENNTLA